MRVREYRYFSCDFETTVFDEQDYTEVWASACVELGTEDVLIFHSIGELYNYFCALKCNIIAYFHNLKFDGSFWLSYLLVDLGIEQAYEEMQVGNRIIKTWLKEKDMPRYSFKYSISARGQWYSIIIRHGDFYIEIRDSLKLLPFSVKRIGLSFKTKHKKLDMEYKGLRYAGCEITEKEKEYIANDVLVVKEALEIMFEEGHKKLTIGSCCLGEYKAICKVSTRNKYEYKQMFQDMTLFKLETTTYKYSTADEYIRKSYRGGWCYVVKEKQNTIYKNGITADVNSLYPSMMSSESGNRYPVGIPYFWSGNYIPDKAIGEDKYYFIRIKTRFYLKENYLPFVQIKGNPLYLGTEALESSDVYDYKTGEYYTHYKDKDGNIKDTAVELTLTMTDYKLLKEHYELVDFEILDGCWFYSEIGIFDEYIEKYSAMKQNSTGARRELAKLFLNNLYGKMASSTDSSFKVAYIKDDKSLGFDIVQENNKSAGYIPVGSAITSYARNFTIRTAQKNFHGKDKRGFIYADTDSIHCDLTADELIGVPVHPKKFCCWKLEATWDIAYFTRQKTYIEHVIEENLEPIEPYYNIKCAGMPDRSKRLFELSMQGNVTETYTKTYEDGTTSTYKWTKEEHDFLFNKDGTPNIRTLSDFKEGLKIPDKLLPKRIKGGIVLKDTFFEMRK